MFFSHRIGVDEWLRVPSVQDVFSIGDCSGFVESTGRQTLPALAQVSDILKNFHVMFLLFQKVCFRPFDALPFGFHRWQKDKVNI
jgi:hypothetical protein